MEDSRFCFGCKSMWFDKNRYQRCAENSTALFYFLCPKRPKEKIMVSANLELPKIERKSR